jgi:stearoyl-CoA desaturase (delta-9 desaturase)
MLSTKQQQIFKFFLTCLLALTGTTIYFLEGGTLLKAFFIYLGCVFVSRVANVGYHRWLAHGLIEPKQAGRVFILWCITATALVKPLQYVVGHRLHHKYSDTDKDPHHTGLGLWNCIIGNFNVIENLSIPIKDILRKSDVMFINKYYYILYFLNLLLFWIIDPDIVLLSFLLLNLRVWLNITIFNYVAHSGKNGKNPVNLPAWTAYVLGYSGEQLHKNHHDNPSASNFGRLSRWNFDFMYHIYKRFVKVKN